MPEHPELIPGTSLPLHAPSGATQTEGRGGVQLTDARQPPSMLEHIGPPDEVSPREQVLLEAAIRAFDRGRKVETTVDGTSQGLTDATTGNLTLILYECPQGSELHITNVTIDVPNSATITPAAPFSNASSYAFIAVAPPSTSPPPALSLRGGLVAFAPTSAAGPFLPGQWTFNDSNARVARGGQAVYFVLVGGSVAAIKGITVAASYRFNIYTLGAR